MANNISASSFGQLFISDTPLLDVRAPVEFSKGAFPTSTSIPLLDDEQRRLVGIHYKEKGRDAAIQLGHELVNSQSKEALIKKWSEFLETNDNPALYCFRGGQRSRISQRWLEEIGIEAPRVEGGYKALRNFLLNTIEVQSSENNFIIAAGKTGSAKTHLINQLSSSVDLEARAQHRGSAFGKRIQAQPSQSDFENQIAIDFLKLRHLHINRVFLEDESHSIGSVHLPKSLHHSMQQSPLAVIEATLESRIETIFNDYILSNYNDYLKQADTHTELAEQGFSQSLLSSLDKIRRRLGGEAFEEIKAIMIAALEKQFRHADPTNHCDWIEKLLRDYYDPMYEFQLSKKHGRIVFRGDGEEFLSWARSINRDSSS